MVGEPAKGITLGKPSSGCMFSNGDPTTRPLSRTSILDKTPAKT